MVWRTDTYTGWGRALSATGELARPERRSALLSLEAAPAIGNRRSYGDACLNDAGRVIDLSRLDRILDFDPLTGLLHVEAGATMADLVRTFAPRGWLLPVMPGTGFATVGGAIAMDVHGKNHHHAGSFGAHVTEIELRQGETVTSITPGSAVFNATVGGLGQTGVILSARIQLSAIDGGVMRVSERRMSGWDEFIAELDGSSASYCVGWIDATARGSALGRGILEEAEVAEGSPPKAGKPRSVPINAPGFALSSPVVRAFNAAYFRRVPPTGRTVRRRFEDFFFPLDRIHDWNRLYGKAGFHQFQCVVPLAEVGALRGMLETVARSGRASPLAVLKRLGPGGTGLMSFPTEGYTLAVDIPAKGRAGALLTELEAATLEAGGRIYLAKDAVAAPASIHAMYPGRETWAQEAATADPEGALLTDLVRRLELRSAP
ncbi:MAG: FAD-binding oxidoreductase [Pseudomonadota bacterium]